MNILILLMSCNKDIYTKEEEACRETFLNDAEKEGIPFYFYKGISEEHPLQLIDKENHVMYLPVNDGLGGTSQKTVMAFSEALKMKDWDYIVKTNVSTWLDVKKIKKAVEKWEGRDDRNVYGARFIANDASKKVPFPRGHFVILSRALVEGVVKWAPVLIRANSFPKTDDTLLCLSILYHMKKVLNDDYLAKLMEVPSVISWSNEIQDVQDWSDALSVRCKDEKEPSNTPENIKKVHFLKRNKKQNKNYRRPLGLIETKYGMLSFKMYEQLSFLIEKVKQQQATGLMPANAPEEADAMDKMEQIREKLSSIELPDMDK